MATRILYVDTLYAGRFYPAGEMPEDAPDDAVEALEKAGAFEEPEQDRLKLDPAQMSDPSHADPDQPSAQPPAGEMGGEDLAEAPRRHFDTRPMLPGSTPAEAESTSRQPRRARQSAPAAE